MTDLKDSVILPREDFIELSSAAYDTHVPVSDRVAQVTQTTVVLGLLTASVAGMAFAVNWASDWAENRREKRKLARSDKTINNPQ